MGWGKNVVRGHHKDTGLDLATNGTHDVAVIDDLSTGSTSNLRAVIDSPRFRFVLGTIESSQDLGTLMAWADQIRTLKGLGV